MTEFQKWRRKIQEGAFYELNNRQKEAAFHVNGPVLILAGAGSGKTTVLIKRIANIVRFGDAYESNFEPEHTEEDTEHLKNVAEGKEKPNAHTFELCEVNPCPAWKVLAITFTNKAAGELKERLVKTLGSEGEQVVAGTFHSFCARLLRQEGGYLGYSSHFTIYDSDDSKRLIKECYKSLNFDEKMISIKETQGEISRAKDALITPDVYESENSGDYRLKKIAAVYQLYQDRLKEADAMDFDDLLCKTVELFHTYSEVLEKWQRRFDYIMVDEYQDTNHAQYELIHLLAGRTHNLCVVGDDDQSIYQFRGATIENILSFEEEFPNCKVIRLEQNYRSTSNILDAANKVIAENKNRKGKTLWTENGEGELISDVTVDDEDAEARFIADTIFRNVSGGKKYKDHVVLYRANAQSNAIERAFVKSAVPYRIFGGHRFYDSQEVRDMLAYLRVIHNPADSVSLRRIVNVPKRGIGETSMEKARQIADGIGETLYDVLKNAADYPDLSRASAKLKDFMTMMEEFRTQYTLGQKPLHELYNEILEKTGYMHMWLQAGKEEEGRVENLRELESSILRYEEDEGEEASLSGFLEEAALMTDVDNYDAEADTVTMMTMHAAKGLEFPVVFLPGFEESVFPSNQAMFEPSKVEEERRLCYVAITRAKQKLYIIHANTRMLYGCTGHNFVSRFLTSIPKELLKEEKLNTFRTPSMSTYKGGSSFDFGGSQETFWANDFGIPKRKPTSVSSGQSIMERQNKPKTTVNTGSKMSFAIGDKVSHSAFGNGTVKSAEPMGNDTMLTIEFESVGIKKLMANYAKLEKV